MVLASERRGTVKYMSSLVTAIPLSLAAGMVLGLIYFYGLMYTVDKLSKSKNPGILVLVSYILRMAVLLAGLYYISGGRWERLTAAMVGFFIVRLIMLRYARTSECMLTQSEEGEENA